MIPVRGIETVKAIFSMMYLLAFKLMIPVRGIETKMLLLVKLGEQLFQINDSRSRD